jgi:hypothetical protein
MAFVHGKNSYISVDGSNLSAYTDNVQRGHSLDTAEVTAFGDDDKEFIAGLMDGSLSLSGHFDATADSALHGCFDGAVVSVIYGPAGNGSGAVRYTANFLITDYSVTSGVGDRVNWSVSLQRSGAYTRDTF